ncbi:MAG: MATE family efflux transporter [Clostridiales bacterium]|nr:MATE family efflux transporter [Clostridiales bacterium]
MTLRKRISPFIGDKAFYRSLMAIAIPVMLQNGLTNLVSLLDNIMVGAVGTEQMTGVSIVNQLLFVFNLCIFGGLSGAGIFTAQFFGKKDTQGVQHTFRFKLMLAMVIFLIALVILSLFSDSLIAMYLHEGGETGDLAATAVYGKEYLLVMLWGLFPFALQQAYASTLRECGETLLPMKAGIIAILANLVLNYIFIFGHLGMPAMGAKGAALATVIARYIECFIIVGWTHRHKDQAPFIVGAYRSMHIPRPLVKDIFIKGMPLLVNEALWSAGMATLTQCYSVRGLAVVAGLNICSTISNLFNVVWMANGTAVSIIVGQQLGANEFNKAKDSVKKIMAFSVASALLTTLLLLVLSPLFPRMYNTTEEVRQIASGLLMIVAFAAPIHAFAHASYFTLRSGGKTWITFLFDSAYLWVISIPVARFLSGGTSLPILPMYAICQYIDIIKCIVGFVLLKKGVWINNIVSDKD